jgi:hypothetical protein
MRLGNLGEVAEQLRKSCGEMLDAPHDVSAGCAPSTLYLQGKVFEDQEEH